MIGKILGNRYELLERLGGGGMAVVYKARDTYLDRMVTVKVLRSEYAGDEAFVARIRKEAQAVARLSHPNIVNIHDVGEEGEFHYLVMEFVDGENLKTIIKRDAPLPPERAVDILQQVCAALGHAHKNNIVHRDVKPHNILVTPEGKAKLADFGIAREISAATLTYSDTVMGSVHYLSPEQARGEVAGPRSDIYSLGIVACEMLSGKLPFEGDTPVGVAMKHIQNKPPAVVELNRSVPPSLSGVISKALQKNPEQRFPSAGEMSEALEQSLADHYNEIDDENMDTRVLPKVGKNTPKKERSHRRLYPWLGVALVLLGMMVWGLFALENFLSVPDVDVPEVTGLPLAEAKSTLEEKQLKTELAGEEFSDQYKAGTVVRQSIGPDDPPVKPGRVIKLTISKGPDLRKVPNLIGKTEPAAVAALLERDLGIAPDKEKEYSDKMEKGRIIEQSPGEGTEVKADSLVHVTISLGPEPKIIVMPNVVGRREPKAKEILAANGLEVVNITWENSSDITYGRVVKQVPEAGKEVKQGSDVQIVLSAGPGPGTRVATVDLKDVIPNDGKKHKVRITVEDARGLHTEYANTQFYGDRFVKNISYRGKAIIRVYVDDRLVVEEEAQ